ncbi:trehalose-phosphatase [Ruicaihuangia caeni]|uniref:Trehalose 6-phosphate phosphatase n=1 Tax=Ruicaihuangia caeni TaxID=3042517 RepID=A0AAW6T0J5_9MICO|nr:trehalose-phosphatase [Klugiella sp. YN-L-19]MDI2097356.1 trehalose-phosphatase [Klugiella sp. YN-L-19]
MTAASLSEALHWVAQVPTLLVALDFDGTLAPEVDDPEQARMLPAAQEAIGRLALLPRTPVALVSGRGLPSLERVAGVTDSVTLVGSHGVEMRYQGRERSLLGTHDLERRRLLGEVLAASVDQHDGVWLEAKPVGFAVHTRLVTHDAAAEAQRSARAAVAASSLSDITERAGKNVLEFAVRPATKGDGIVELRTLTGADAVLFAGDDVTDEDALAALEDGDLGLKCGAPPTHAQFCVPAPADVAEVLLQLAEQRSAYVHRRE